MDSPEFVEFMNVIGSMLSLRSGRKALSLRKTLGASLDKRLSDFPKGIVQEMKGAFISYAKITSGVNWSAEEPHKIITTLKNSGNGDERMVCALYFLCCKTSEFPDLRDALYTAIGEHKDIMGWPPRIEYRLSFLIGGNWRETRNQIKKQIQSQNAQRVEMEQRALTEAELKTGFRYILDHELDYSTDIDNGATVLREIGARTRNAKFDAYTSDGEAETDEDKVAGRKFVENQATEFIETHSWPAYCGTLSIVDIDDLTKINKVYGSEVGDLVILIVGHLIEKAIENLIQKSGRCGDDTFFIVLAKQDQSTTSGILNRLLKDVQNYDWHQEAYGLRVTVSIGTAGYRNMESSIDLAVRAGLGMKRAKTMGGNVTSTGPSFLPHSDHRHWESTLNVWS